MRFISLVPVLVVGLLVGCNKEPETAGWVVSEGGDDTSFGDSSDVVIGPGDGSSVVITGDGGAECVELQGDVCLNPDEVRDEECGGDAGQADIILDEDGEVLEVICYPPSDEGTPIDEVEIDGDGNAEVPQSDNGAVVIFDEETNGEPIEGDVTLTAERVTLFGNGVDQTIIDGNLRFSSNNSAVRGLTVTGNVTIDGISNGASLVFCKIHGNLEVEGNSVTVANCQVFGNVDVTGGGATLVNIGVQGDWNVNDRSTCQGCYSFADENDDFIVADDERGDDLTCGD